MQQSKNGRRVGRVEVISALLLTTVSVGGRLMASLSPSLPLPWGGTNALCFTKIIWPYLPHTLPLTTSKHQSMHCFKKNALRNDYRGTTTKELIVHCRWHISQGAFIAAWPFEEWELLSEGGTGPHLHNWGGNTCAPCGSNKEGRSS